jgi:hypothetical protein
MPRMVSGNTPSGPPALAQVASEIDALIDEMLAYFDQWRQEVAAVEETYRRWCAAPSAERDRSFGVYIAALDQEEAAAIMYGSVAAELRSMLLRA